MPPSHRLHPTSFTLPPPHPLRIMSFTSGAPLRLLHIVSTLLHSYAVSVNIWVQFTIYVCSVGLGSLQSWSKPNETHHITRKWRLVICCAAEEDECFDPATKGRLYRGQKDYTRSMKLCMDWTETTHCLHHAFKPGYTDLHTSVFQKRCSHLYI